MSGFTLPITVTGDSYNECINWLEEAIEIVNELKLQREVDFHENIIRFFGVTTQNQNDNFKKYWLVMEYANNGTLHEYLKKHFDTITWNDKFNIALQLAHAVLCLHDEGIVHRDLHSKNILVHQNTINIGVLMWEISSGQPPFDEISSYGLIVRIPQGLRETPVPDTPTAYVNLYTECWDGEPDNRPTISQVVAKLKVLNSSSQINNNFGKIVDEIINLPNKTGDEVEKQEILNYLKNHNVTLKEIYNWLLNDQNNTNSIVLLGDFNLFGIEIIEINVDKKEAFELYQKAANLGNTDGINSLAFCYEDGIGTDIDKRKAFELYQKAADLGNATGITNLGRCYQYGIGTDIDKRKAFELYQQASYLGKTSGINKLGYCYESGIGTDIDKRKAFELYQKAADLGNATGINEIGYCYENGIGTNINKKKAFELYQKAADLGNATGINNLGYCYESGIGTNIDKKKAFELYQKAAKLELQLE
ncbi:kinase-like domain-containing protein [Rhizophagus irregularis DAOM 181602=DAOM 197198]|nr:kinase-like domain-containing protein [Rhizophagus irregularis DAOM 181602=DAOM 197198]